MADAVDPKTDPEWRKKRDEVIRAAHSLGASVRLLADVFDVTPSRVCAIVGAGSGHPPNPEPEPPAVIPFGRGLKK